MITSIKFQLKIIILVLIITGPSHIIKGQFTQSKEEILKSLIAVNDYFMEKYHDYKVTSNDGGERPSNIWTRGVYYEGLMALYGIFPQEKYYDYTYNWANFHQWDYRNGPVTRNADDYCAGQTYIDMYRICPDPERIRKVKANLDMLVNTPQDDDWWWIDAIQMGMPVFVKLGVTLNDTRYFDKMWEMYEHCRNQMAGNGLFNPEDGLWWRDGDFTPPYKEPNGKNCYWSRGNGWVYAALARILQELPENEKHYQDYLADFKSMTAALVQCQREDGFWNVSLHDPDNFGGKEVTGTSLFIYGMTWGINNNLLPQEKFLPIVTKAWNAVIKDAVHPNGFLGYVQGTGKEPKDGQPVSYTNIPNFEDFGTGCFLLAGSEVYKIADFREERLAEKSRKK